MPSVGMRRNTRVFGARVLRSGRKHARVADGEDWIGLLDDSVSGGGDAIQLKENGMWHDDIGSKEEIGDIGNEDTREPDGDGEFGLMGLSDEKCGNRMWGAVYQRKRKRVVHLKGYDSSGNSGEQRAPDRMYGKQFFRKHCRKRIRRNPIQVVDSNSGFGLDDIQGSLECGLLVESSCGSCCWFSCFLNSVLRYMRSFRVGMQQLSAFLSSEPINHVFSSHGIHFLQDSASFKRPGVCKILDSRRFMPLFTVDFSALPFCFVYLHSSLLLRSASLPNVLVKYTESLKTINDDQMINHDDQPSSIPWEGNQSLSITEAVENGNSRKKSEFHPIISTPKVPGKTLQLRNGVTSRCIQKRRSSLRSKRGRNYSSFGIRTTKRAVTDLFLGHDGRIPSSPLSTNRSITSPIWKSSTTSIKELKSSVVGLTNDLDSTSCSANILVIESDKGYREQGVMIKLEMSSSDQWFISVTRDGMRRCSIKPQSVMRPYCCNRFTHAIIWKDDGSNGWMLEFFSRKDWSVFKELHRECFDRNLQAPSVNIIPVPVVREVPGYADDGSVPFERPDLYISWKDDEVGRALANGMVNYDLDFDDEEWLNKFNNEFCGDNEIQLVSPDTFEKIIYAFERGLYCSPDEYSDARTAADLCVDLERKEVLEAVHSYWLKKRKQKRSALVRVFQCYQPRRAQLLPKAVLRKKRSFKRRGNRNGRDKRQFFLRAMAVEQNNPVDEEASILKVQEAKAAASRSEDGAILKRQKAQLLMQTAELATYKATMALRIAEAAQVSESPDAAASFFLG